MIITIPVGRIVRWAAQMKHGYSPIEEGNVHAFLNRTGMTKPEAKAHGGDPWCLHCGRSYRKHPDIDYPVFVPPPDWEEWAEADVPIGYLRPPGQPVRWPYEVVTDRGLVVHLYAVDEKQAYQHTIDFELTHTRTPVFVILNLPVPGARGVCLECGVERGVTTYGSYIWGAGIDGVLETGFLKGLCGPCSVSTYIKSQSRGDCQTCGGAGWKPLATGRAWECHTCGGSGLQAS